MLICTTSLSICQIFAKYLPVYIYIYSSLLNFQFKNCDVNFINYRGEKRQDLVYLVHVYIYIYYVHDSFLYPFWWHSSEGCLLIWRLCWHHSPGSAATWRLSPRPSSSLRIRCDCSLPFPSIQVTQCIYTSSVAIEHCAWRYTSYTDDRAHTCKVWSCHSPHSYIIPGVKFLSPWGWKYWNISNSSRSHSDSELCK